VIDLPNRADKLELFSLVSSVSGFNLDILEGVKGENMNNKTLSALEYQKIQNGGIKSLDVGEYSYM